MVKPLAKTKPHSKLVSVCVAYSVNDHKLTNTDAHVFPYENQNPVELSLNCAKMVEKFVRETKMSEAHSMQSRLTLCV